MKFGSEARLELEVSVGADDRVFDRVLDAVTADIPIFYTKINHNFWERLVFLDRVGVSYLESDPVKAKEADAIKGSIGRPPKAFVETGFVSELFALIKAAPLDDPGFVFCASLDALPESNRLQGIPVEDRELCLRKINEIVPTSSYSGDGLEFKRALINGRFLELVACLRTRRFLLVANQDLQSFPEFIGARAADFCEIHGSEARYDREAVLQSILDWVGRSEENRRIVVQCGGSLSTWLALKLYKIDRSLTFLDIGNALCICNPTAIFGRIFGCLFRSQIMRTMERINPGWFSRMSSTNTTFSDRNKIDPTLCCVGRSELLVSRAEKAGVSRPNSFWSPRVQIGAPLNFVENKPADPNRMAEFLSLSSSINHYANFGPVSRLLERCVHDMLRLPDDRAVVACSSCTTGLQVAAGIAAHALGRRPNWIASAFTFFSAAIGHYSDVRLIDSSAAGGTDPAELQAQPADLWDAVLFTNTFAQCLNEWKAVRNLCRETGKFLIVDNALGLLDRPNAPYLGNEIEVISLHHTKPWGFGEGGIMIVPAAQEAAVRSLLNFAADSSVLDTRFATNGKMADVAAAAVLDRLERMEHWRVFYDTQAFRLRHLIRKSGLPLDELPSRSAQRSPSPSLQYLAPYKVPVGCLQNDRLVLRKYYRPLGQRKTESADQFSQAHVLYDRIICIPCHPFVRTLSDAELVETLERVLARAREAGNDT